MSIRVRKCAHTLCAGLAALVLVTSIGCGGTDASDATVTVSGTVKLDDKPLADAIVTFQAEGAKKNYFGKTKSDGTYKFDTAIGASKVSVAKPSGGGGSMSPNEMMSKFEKGAKKKGVDKGPTDSGDKKKGMGATKSSGVPTKYEQPGTSGLEADVKKGGNNVFDFNLSSK